jgi:hypothetical protein
LLHELLGLDLDLLSPGLLVSSLISLLQFDHFLFNLLGFLIVFLICEGLLDLPLVQGL